MANVPSSGFASRFTEARQRAGLTVADIAKRLGITIQSVYGWEKGSVPKSSRMSELADMFDVPLQWLAFGEGIPTTLRDENGNWSVPVLSVEASAGEGEIVSTESVVRLMELDPSWVRQIYPCASRGGLHIVTVHGESMEPTFKDKDILLVDSTINSIRREGFYVLSYGGLAYVKRVQPTPDGKLCIISDNPMFRSFEVDLKDASIQIKIHGLVIYSWEGKKR